MADIFYLGKFRELSPTTKQQLQLNMWIPLFELKEGDWYVPHGQCEEYIHAIGNGVLNKRFDLNEGIKEAYELCAMLNAAIDRTLVAVNLPPKKFICPYCKKDTADCPEGYIEDDEDENDPEAGETRWYCSNCHAEWWAYGQEQPEREKVLMISPRYPDDDWSDDEFTDIDPPMCQTHQIYLKLSQGEYYCPMCSLEKGW